MAEVEELLDDVTVRMPSGAELRARGGRRTMRRRVAGGVAVVAALAGVVTWGVASGGGGGDGREVRPAATPTDNPFKVGGVVRLLSPELMPQATKWHWKSMEEEVMVDLPLPKVGRDKSCPGSDAGRKAPSQVQYGTEYYSDKGANARQRVTEYDSASVAADEVSRLRDALTECGLWEHAEGADPYWFGTTESSSRLRVSIERWRGWVSVVEVEVDGRG
ncbi:hypothetical protein ACFQ0X_16445 [Streptomyces rectiviolaceus]|uniref:Uncharacterized protein n=1 Tax=Streptomyces rectiviolaceus TaxID=332591 RepID=A0ABP6ME14_9ACTN